MFQFRRFPSLCYFIHITMLKYCFSGLLHSEIHGSMPACGSPWLIAARCVLRRLPVPRHSPCALCSLTCLVLYVFIIIFLYGFALNFHLTLFTHLTSFLMCFVVYTLSLSLLINFKKLFWVSSLYHYSVFKLLFLPVLFKDRKFVLVLCTSTNF